MYGTLSEYLEATGYQRELAPSRCVCGKIVHYDESTMSWHLEDHHERFPADDPSFYECDLPLLDFDPKSQDDVHVIIPHIHLTSG